MKLRQLETFVAVAEELHFGRAARRLHRSQSPVSRQITQLEEELGVDLFVRNTQSVALTHAGTVLLKEIKPALNSIQQALRAARRAAEGQVGVLSLGMTPSIMFGVLPRLLNEFKQRYPEIVVNMHLAAKADQLSALREGQLQIALVRSLTHDIALCQEVLLDEPLVLAMGPSNPLAARAQVQLADLANEEFILYRGQSQLSVADQIISACHTAGFSPKVVQETDDMQSAAALAAMNVGVTLIASSLQQLGLSGLVCRPVLLGAAPLAIPLYAVYRRDDTHFGLGVFLELARDMCQTITKPRQTPLP